MIITNKFNLPESLVKAVKNDDYSAGEKADFSATSLLNPPLINQLYKKHIADIQEDVSERLFSLMGQAMHHIIERADDQLTEKRLYLSVDGKTISGQFDRFVVKSGTVQDYKFTSVWEYIYGLKPEKTQQLNIYAELLRANGFGVKHLEIVQLFRDWSKSKADYDSKYPQEQINIIEVELWESEKTIDFIKKRLKSQDDTDYICTPDDRWRNGEKWAVMKDGRKSAVKLHNSLESAESHKAELDDKHFIEHRKGQDNRCKSYCPVRKFCEHNKER